MVFTREGLTLLPTIRNIDATGVQKLLEDLDIRKAPGPDNIPSKRYS